MIEIVLLLLLPLQVPIQMIPNDLNLETIVLQPYEMIMKENTELTMFYVRHWELVHTDEKNLKSGIKLNIILQRRMGKWLKRV